ncbi:MAG TPA: hypothetical protein VG326_05335 [Tepidisphaeraceae bacterium]|jgi:predicted  nucleic acid-binding Zn-ribbon protein|nr:hypothetical protein [Tepidisphaeraceae bacterium]
MSIDDDMSEPALASEMGSDPAAASGSQIACPQCGQPVDLSSAAGPILQCPNCGTQFFPPVSEEESDASRDEAKAEHDTEAELSELRIRQLSTLRRTAYRTRSYLVVGTLGCLGFAIQLLIFTFHDVRERHHWGPSPIAYLLFAVAGLIGSYKFAVRVVEIQLAIKADLRARELEEQEAAKHEPDLSTLSDGSQHARNLERMFDATPGPGESPAPESSPTSSEFR